MAFSVSGLSRPAAPLPSPAAGSAAATAPENEARSANGDHSLLAPAEEGEAPAGLLSGMADAWGSPPAATQRAIAPEGPRSPKPAGVVPGSPGSLKLSPGETELSRQARSVGSPLPAESTRRYADLVQQRFPGVDPKQLSGQYLRDNVQVHVIDGFGKAGHADVDGDGKNEKFSPQTGQVGSHGDTVSRLYDGMGFKNVDRYGIRPDETNAAAVERFAREKRVKPGDIVNLSLGTSDGPGASGDYPLPERIAGQLGSASSRSRMAAERSLSDQVPGISSQDVDQVDRIGLAVREIQKQGGFVIGAGSNSGPGTFNPATSASDLVSSMVGVNGRPNALSSPHAGTVAGLGQYVLDQKSGSDGQPSGVGVAGTSQVLFPQSQLSGGQPLVRGLEGQTPAQAAEALRTPEQLPRGFAPYVEQGGGFLVKGTQNVMGLDTGGRLRFDPAGTRGAQPAPVSVITGASEVPPALATRLVEEIQPRLR